MAMGSSIEKTEKDVQSGLRFYFFTASEYAVDFRGSVAIMPASLVNKRMD